MLLAPAIFKTLLRTQTMSPLPLLPDKSTHGFKDAKLSTLLSPPGHPSLPPSLFQMLHTSRTLFTLTWSPLGTHASGPTYV